jgi:hypothetical protein
MDPPPPTPIDIALKSVERLPSRNCICHFHKAACDCPPIGTEHHSDCRCSACLTGGDRLHPIGGRFHVGLLVFLVLFWTGLTLLFWQWVHPPQKDFVDPNGSVFERLEPNPKTCFEYQHRVRNTFCKE